MAGINSLLSVARDGIMAQSYALGITGQNIANANTPGYVRREAVLETRAAGSETFGGIEASGLRRVLDPYVEERYFKAVGDDSHAQERNAALESIEAIFNDQAGAGIGSSLNALFSSFSSLAANPSDITTRGLVLQRADELAGRMRDSAASMNAIRRDLLDKAKNVTTLEINQRAEQIAKLNGKIVQAEASGADAADLRDQQRQLVVELSERINVHTFTDDSGALVVQAAGATLVEGTRAGTMEVSTASNGSIQLLMVRANGTQLDVTGQLNGGTLAGIREARDVDAVEIMGRVDQLAADIANAINGQHASGFGLDGVNGRPMFDSSGGPLTAATMQLSAIMRDHPERVAASNAAGALPGGSDNAVALSKLSTTPVASGGLRSITESYSDLVGDVGLRKSKAATDVEMRDGMTAQIKAMRDSAAGVSLDEEMISLTRYQRAYEASTKLLRTADELLQTLIKG